MQTYFGYFGHAWLHSPKMIVSSSWRLQCLSACKKINSIIQFLEYCILKNPAISLAYYLEEQLCQICFGEIAIIILGFIIDYFQEKLTWQNFWKNLQNPILGPFWSLLPKCGSKMNFSGKRALSVFQYLNYLPLCQKSEKPNEPFLRKLLDGHIKN